jgi:3-deoxy-D-manno-octulosonic-acid transferase
MLGIDEDALLVVCGSTHPIEEEQLVEAYLAVRSRYPTAQLLLAPRHIERAEAVEAMVRARGLVVSRRSAVSGQAANRMRPQVVILDSRGELAMIYQEATVAFVGGTLVPVGGHNLLEPAFWSKPIVFGPYTDHCVEIADLLLRAGGGLRVTTVEELAKQLLHLFERQDELMRMGQAAQSVVRQNQGALQATVEAIDSQLVAAETNRASTCSRHPFPVMAGR